MQDRFMKYLLQREMQKFDKLHDKRFNKLDIPRDSIKFINLLKVLYRNITSITYDLDNCNIT